MDGGLLFVDCLGNIVMVNATTATANSAVFISSGSAVFQSTSSTAGHYILQVKNLAASEVFRVQQNGRVGIGTTSPNQNLTVAGSIDLGAAQSILGSGTNSYVGLSGASVLSSGSGAQILLYGNTSAGTGQLALISGNTSGGHITFAPKDTEKMRITDTGSVGIGTTSPSSTLDVQGAAQFGSGANVSTFSATGALTIANTAGATPFQVGTSTLVVNNGRVGIGTTAPLYPLSVIGNIGISEGSYLYNNTRGTAIIGTNGTTGDTEVMVSSSGKKLALWDYSAARLTVDTGGNIGIGTTSPSAALHVVAGTTGNGVIFPQYSFAQLCTSSPIAEGVVVQGPTPNYDLYIGTGTSACQWRIQGTGTGPSCP